MVGIIISGHGKFATGLNSSVELIAGAQDNLQLVDFLQEDTLETLTIKLENAMKKLSDCNGIIVFTDLPGGSPFKTAVEVSINFDNVKVIGGTNMPMLCEIAMARNFIDDIDSLVNMAINTGKEQVVKFEQIKRKQEISDEGI